MISTQVTWRRSNSVTYFGGPIRRMLDRRRLDAADETRAGGLVQRFLSVAGGLNLGRDTSSCAGIPGFAIPQVRHVVLGSDVDSLTIEMMPGQLLTDYLPHEKALAEGLGYATCSLRRLDHGRIIADLHHTDPLASPVELPPLGVAPLLMVGMCPSGPLEVDLAKIAHIVVQGSTRSGKSRWTYGWLRQLAGRPDVVISGTDVSGLLLRVFEGTRHADVALGSLRIEQHAEVLERAVSAMDDRLARMPARSDVLPITEQDPYRVIVIEEFAGLMFLAESADGKRNGPLALRIRAAYSRLLAEGAKVGVRLLLITQRADADLIGGFPRGQMTFRITFPVMDPASVKMLHPAADEDLCTDHLSAAPGQALITGPGMPLSRLRAGQMGDYGDYLDDIGTLAPGLDDDGQDNVHDIAA